MWGIDYMDKINWKQEFSDIIEHNSQNLYEICKRCMQRLEECPNFSQDGFQYFLTLIPLPRYTPDEIPETFFDIEESEIDEAAQKRIGEMESQIVKELIFKDVSVNTFYNEIWKRISDTLLVSDIYQKSFFLLRMWLDPRIPYYRLGLGVDMNNDTYKKLVQQVNPQYKKMLFAMYAGYPKRTQKASILMEIAEEIPDQNGRIVFWSLTMGRLENQIQSLKTRIHELESLTESDDMEIE